MATNSIIRERVGEAPSASSGPRAVEQDGPDSAAGGPSMDPPPPKPKGEAKAKVAKTIGQQARSATHSAIIAVKTKRLQLTTYTTDHETLSKAMVLANANLLEISSYEYKLKKGGVHLA